jgi:hypothetical protein
VKEVERKKKYVKSRRRESEGVDRLLKNRRHCVRWYSAASNDSSNILRGFGIRTNIVFAQSI